MRIKATGLGAYDFDVPLGKLNVVAAPCRAGKSSIGHAITFAGLGALPHLGREYASTAQLMRGRGMTATLTLDDGRRITRKLSRTPSGGLTRSTDCSWLGGDKKADSKAHEAAAVALFGDTLADAEEAFDIYSTLIKLTGAKRAQRIQAMLPGSQTPAELAQRVGHYLYQFLTGLPDEQMPADLKKLRPSIKGYAGTDDGPHTGHLGAVIELFPWVIQKLEENGLGAAQDWINAQRRDRAKLTREATQALNELKRRLQEIVEPQTEELAEAEGALRQLEQEIGAALARRDQVEQLLGKIVLADRKVSAAKQAAAQAQAARATFEDGKLGDLTAARARVAEIDGELGMIALPAPVAAPGLVELEAEAARLATIVVLEPSRVAPPDDAPLTERLSELTAAHDEIVVPEVVSIAAEEGAVQEAIRRLEAARGTFPAFVAEQMQAILAQPPGISDAAQGIAQRVLDRAGTEGAASVAGLSEAVERARRALTARRALRDAAEVVERSALAHRAEITREIGVVRERLDALRCDADAAYRLALESAREEHAEVNVLRRENRIAIGCLRTIALFVDAAALIDYEHGRAAPAAERSRLIATIAALEAQDRDTQAAVTETTATLTAAEESRRALGEAPEDAGAADRAPTQRRDEMAERVNQMRAHRTLWDEHHRTVADLEARTDVQVVLGHLEAAVKKVMAEEAVTHGGPLLEFMGRYLSAAECSELPYIQATKDEVDFGWVVTKSLPGVLPEKRPVSIAALSGSELTLYLAGLEAGIKVLRGVEQRILLVEAESCDEPMLQQLLAGIAGIADEITCAVVATPRPPAAVPAGWSLVTPGGAIAAEAA